MAPIRIELLQMAFHRSLNTAGDGNLAPIRGNPTEEK